MLFRSRELSKCVSAPNEVAFKEMLKTINFVLGSKELGLQLKPKFNKSLDEWVVVVFTDSDWAGSNHNQSLTIFRGMRFRRCPNKQGSAVYFIVGSRKLPNETAKEAEYGSTTPQKAPWAPPCSIKCRGPATKAWILARILEIHVTCYPMV